MSLCFERYSASGGDEWMMRTGIGHSEQAIVLAPVLQESARVRGFLATLMRALDERGVGCTLPDLPGCGESEQALPERLAAWHASAGAARVATDARMTIAVRSGALFDSLVPAACRWRLAPVGGAAVMRDLVRTGAIASAETGERVTAKALGERARSSGAAIAGFTLTSTLVCELEQASPDDAAGRTVRLIGDDRPADIRFDGPLLWRAAEPVGAPRLATAIADDICAWAETCDVF